MLEHKGYVGWFEFDGETERFQGRVSNIKTVISFEGKTVENTKLAFKDAVEDYLAWCKNLGQLPEKPSPDENETYFVS